MFTWFETIKWNDYVFWYQSNQFTSFARLFCFGRNVVNCHNAKVFGIVGSKQNDVDDIKLNIIKLHSSIEKGLPYPFAKSIGTDEINLRKK